MSVFIFSDGRVSFPVVLGQVDVAVLRPRGEQTKDQRQKRHPDLLLGSQLVSFLLFLKVVSHNFEFTHLDCGFIHARCFSCHGGTKCQTPGQS